MHRDQLHIAEPCNVSWESMEGAGCVRFCGQCRKDVHDLSDMTEREARKVLAQEDVCVQYHCDSAGRVAFRPSRAARALALAGALLSTPALASSQAKEDPAPKNDDTSLLDRVMRWWLGVSASTEPAQTESRPDILDAGLVTEPVHVDTGLQVSPPDERMPRMRGKVKFHPNRPATPQPQTTNPSTNPPR